MVLPRPTSSANMNLGRELASTRRIAYNWCPMGSMRTPKRLGIPAVCVCHVSSIFKKDWRRRKAFPDCQMLARNIESGSDRSAGKGCNSDSSIC